MEENKQTNNENAEAIKNETVNTVNDVKETIKNVNIKKDTLETKGFIKDFFTKPLETIQEVVNDNSNKFLTFTIIILAVWVVAALIRTLGTSTWVGSTWNFQLFFNRIGQNLLSIVKAIIAPLLTVLTLSVLILVFSKNNKKKLTTIIEAVTTAYIPVAIASVVRLLVLFSRDVTRLTSPFASFCSTITLILTYFVAKNALGMEKHSEFIKKFVLIEACYYLAYFVFTFLGIYI